MKLLIPIARKILLPPFVVFSITLIYQLYKGESVDIQKNIETLIFLSGGVLAVWAPLPLAQHFSCKFSQKWQSLMRLFFGVAFASITFGSYIFLVINFELFN